MNVQSSMIHHKQKMEPGSEEIKCVASPRAGTFSSTKDYGPNALQRGRTSLTPCQTPKTTYGQILFNEMRRVGAPREIGGSVVAQGQG